MARLRRRLPSPRSFVWAFVAMLVALRLVTGGSLQHRRTFSDPPLQAGNYEVVQVLSGDRIVLRQDGADPVTVQLIGTSAATELIDGVKNAASARQFTRDFLANREVTVALDNHRLDLSGIYLVYLKVDGKLLNEALLFAGWARFVRQPGNAATMERRLADAQRAAQRLQLGLWASPQ